MQQLSQSASFRRRAWGLLRWGLFLLVVAFVARQVATLWRQADVGKIVFSPAWLLAAVPVTVIAWLPSVGYWRALLATLGHRVRWRDAARAYFCGHLGKYVPGKATVLLIRTGLLQGCGVRPGTAALTSTYEVLVTFAAATFVGLAALPWTLDRDEAERLLGFAMPTNLEYHWSMTVIALVLNLIGLHICSHFFSRLVLWMMPRSAQDAAVSLPRARWTASAGWFLLLMAGWCVQGLSLGLTVRAVSGQAFAWDQWPLWTAAISLASVIGFVTVFAPAGLFVREGLLIKMLASEIGGPEAVVAAVLLRAAGLAGEFLIGGILYYGVKPTRMEPAD